MNSLWTLEKLSALTPSRLEVLRQNAERQGDTNLVQQCTDLQQSRKKPSRSTPPNISPVIGFHFVCQDDYEVEQLPNGDFWSGVWAISPNHCQPAKDMSGYVALHQSKKNHSYRQGLIIDWKSERRSKGGKQDGVTFLLRPFEQSMIWFGNGSGEKGYRRVTDHPSWKPPV
jgi:hypothetical protein